METKRKLAYSSPRLTEFGTVEDITRGTGWDLIDFVNGKVTIGDGNIFGWGSGSHNGSS
jgi:hypothetical protein